MQPFFIGDTPFKPADQNITGGFTELLGEPYYRIQGYDAMEPFFLSLVSASDHWMFISSNGGLTAGRANAEQALFPYYTEDKIRDHAEDTGSKTLIFCTRAGQSHFWEPFSPRQRGAYEIRRSIYKNVIGSAVLFEEENLDLGLRFRYAWRTGETYGFVRTAWLTNTGGGACQIELLDGLQNILPANIDSQTQNVFSVLLDAYKRSELQAAAGLAIFSLSSRLTDLAEPSESLLATTAAQIGLQPDAYLLSAAQLERFRAGCQIVPEADVRGRRGAYFIRARLDLDSERESSWHLIADVCQDHARLAWLIDQLELPAAELSERIESDLDQNTAALQKLVGAADGLQVSRDPTIAAHHYANTLFNIMRGGVFPEQFLVKPALVQAQLKVKNRNSFERSRAFFEGLPEQMLCWDLVEAAEAEGEAGLITACRTYLPLTFSRRHGDPSRPWNQFSIQIKHPDGRRRFGYEGNWRDIFQNWEALAQAFPEYIESMIHVFLNATTVDGYNPYRLTEESIDWEVPEPENPWSNIGYWSDHQIIYLLKLMESSCRMHPGKLAEDLNRKLFSYANVPYRIKPFSQLVADPHRSIEFDHDLDGRIESQIAALGTDAKLVIGPDGQVLRVTLAEKLLSLLLAKLANFVPEGGIWMNTQRPEWNDANNALVGNGVSVVTLGYLLRYVMFFRDLLVEHGEAAVEISAELNALYEQMAGIIARNKPLTRGHYSPTQRLQMIQGLGKASSAFRWKYYRQGLSGETRSVPPRDLLSFLEVVKLHLAHTLKANRLENGLYHTYNILELGKDAAEIQRLDLMLEGQVSILSSGLLNGHEALQLLKALRTSPLYRADQKSYLLYPDRRLPGFLEKNRIPSRSVQELRLVSLLLDSGDTRLITRDRSGDFHFNSQFRNRRDLDRVLDSLRELPEYAGLIAEEGDRIRALFEQVFQHNRFTGRAGTFFAYEGLGSIYWHMVAKLLLAAQENALRFKDSETGPELKLAYQEIRAGLGYKKSPETYGAFPADPYSHTPSGSGARQPGMTGVVKEEILTRQAELGLFIRNGRIAFDFTLFDPAELIQEKSVFRYLDVKGRERELSLAPDSLAFTYCQTPVVILRSQTRAISVIREESSHQIEGHVVDLQHSRHIMQRDGFVDKLEVYTPF